MILNNPHGDWLVVEAENISSYQSNLHIRFSGGGRMVEVVIGLFPGWPVRFGLPLTVAEGGTLFLPRQRGLFKMMVGGANLARADIERIEVRGPEGGEGTIRLGVVSTALVAPEPLPLPSVPLADSLHQWTGRTWVGKAGSMEEVRENLLAELSVGEEGGLSGRSRHGGWEGLRWEATGAFRTHHDGRRWWLVDPEGHAFWSVGVDCIGPGVAFPCADMEGLVEGGLPDAARHPGLWSDARGHRLFDAGIHNLERALGAGWRGDWEQLTRRRLRECGFNTVANWSDTAFAARSGLPRVLTLREFPGTARTLFRDFPDVFSPEFERNATAFAGQLAGLAADPFVIGYFMANEPQWAFVDGLDLAGAVLRLGAGTATHAAIVEFLRERYVEIGRLNAAWQSTFTGWQAFDAPVDADRIPASAGDRAEFTRHAVERFVGIPARCCRRVAPRLLNLGLRWAWIHSEYQFAGAGDLDVFSINCYQVRPDAAVIDRVAAATGLPVIIGEFHVGALDCGLPCAGIRAVTTLRESVSAYAHYLEHAAAHPAVVGAHYFQWNDQHVLGRFDGENMQIGLVDITGRMYPEWRIGARVANARIYRVAAGEEEPTTPEPREVRVGTLCG